MIFDERQEWEEVGRGSDEVGNCVVDRKLWQGFQSCARAGLEKEFLSSGISFFEVLVGGGSFFCLGFLFFRGQYHGSVVYERGGERVAD